MVPQKSLGGTVGSVLGSGCRTGRRECAETLRDLLLLWGKVSWAHGDWWAATGPGCCGPAGPLG